MTSATRSENKRKIDDLTKEVAEIRELAERTAADQEATRRRLDRVDKSTMIVVEFSTGIEALYTVAESTRNFKNLGPEAAAAVLKEIAVLTKLPYPLPGTSAEEWQSISAETREFELGTVKSWWQLCAALPEAIQFVMPNRTRAKRDPSTRAWTREPSHFVLKLRFGLSSLLIQDSLQGKFAAYLAKFIKTRRENGVTDTTNLFINRTQEELDRRRGKGKGEEKGKSKGKGKGKGAGRGRGSTQR